MVSDREIKLPTSESQGFIFKASFKVGDDELIFFYLDVNGADEYTNINDLSDIDAVMNRPSGPQVTDKIH